MTQSVGATTAMQAQCWRERIAAGEATGKYRPMRRDEGIAEARYHWRKGALTPLFSEVPPGAGNAHGGFAH